MAMPETSHLLLTCLPGLARENLGNANRCREEEKKKKPDMEKRGPQVMARNTNVFTAHTMHKTQRGYVKLNTCFKLTQTLAVAKVLG